jgi:hypothetical protein
MAKGAAFVGGEQEGTFIPGLWFKPGLKVTFQSRLELPAMTKPLILFGGSNRD